MEMDLRKEAEERARKREQASNEEQNRRSSFRFTQQQIQQKKRQSIQTELQLNESDYSSQVNDTPKIAQLAEIDYKWNGARARAHNENFIIPRWVPDEEIMYCHACNSEFDFVNRKHHCRHCGMVYCEDCSLHRDLVPHEFGYKDPVRVCNACHEHLAPQQQYLSTNIANHARVNNIDVASTNCNVRRYMNMPYAGTLGSEIRKAAYSTHNLFSQALYYVRDKAIPLRFLASAKGLAFLTVVKGGFIFAPRMGTGLVIARLPDNSWSAPSAICTFGLSWGFVAGLDVTDYVIILNTTEAVQAFSGSGQLTIGAGIEVAVGPVGRSGSADIHLGTNGMAPAFSYSHSRGLFAGISLDGSIIAARPDVNSNFYGRGFSPAEILSGKVDPPRAAQPLYDALAEAQSSLPDVQHSKLSHANHAAYSLSSTQDSVNDSMHTSYSSGSSNNTSMDHTTKAIQDIDNLLHSSAVSSLSSSTHSTHSGQTPHSINNNNPNYDHVSNRRRTMAHVPWTQVQPTEYTHTKNPENDLNNSTISVEGTANELDTTNTSNVYTHTSMTESLAPAVQYAPFKHPNNDYSNANHTYATNFPTNHLSNNSNTNDIPTYGDIKNVNNNVTQRRRPRSLPETRGDFYSPTATTATATSVSNNVHVPPSVPTTTGTLYLNPPSTVGTEMHNVPFGDSNDYLADVPRPAYASSVQKNVHSESNKVNKTSLMEESCVASRIDEELEFVTSNIDMLL